MLFRTHLLFSVAVAILLLELMEISMPLVFFIFVLAATAFVDIDSKKSRAGKRLIFRPIQILFSHRGGIHSLLAAVLFSLVIASVLPWAGVGFFVGYISHLFLDFLTRAGVPLFWPLTSKKLGLGLKTSGIIEEIISVALIFVDILLVVNFLFRIF